MVCLLAVIIILQKKIYCTGFYYASIFQMNKLHASFAVLISQTIMTAVVHSLGNTFNTLPTKQKVGMLAGGFRYLS